MNPDDELVRLDDAAKVLCVASSTVKKYCRCGLLRSRRFLRGWRLLRGGPWLRCWRLLLCPLRLR